MERIWTLVVIVGPILFGAVLLFALLRNRFQHNQTPRAVSEQAAKDLREELDEEDARRDGRA